MKRINCPICGQDNTEILFTKGNVGNEIKNLVNVICRQCGLVYLNPRPDDEEILNLQVAPGASGHHSRDTKEKVLEKIETSDQPLKEAVALKIIDWLPPSLGKEARVLDVGCGFGTLLHILKEKKDIIGDGIELNEHNVHMAKELFGLDIFQGSLEQFHRQHGDRQYDLIILHHTFEHFANPLAELARIKDLLLPEGRLYIAVPNILNIKKRPELFFQLGHFFSYSPASLNKILEKAGFKITAFSWVADYPGGMQCMARKEPSAAPRTVDSNLEKGLTAEEIIKYVQKKENDFGNLRKWRDRLLLWLPESMRVAISRPIYLFLKKRK